MAQSGFTPIQLYRSATPGAVPTAGNLAAGELALNTADEKLFFKNSSNVVVSIDRANGTVTSVSGTGTVNGITLTGTVTSSGSLTLGGTLSGVDLATQTSGTLAVGRGGTGATSLTANNVLLGNGTSALQVVAPGANGNVLTSNGTTWVSQAPAASGATKGQAIAFSIIFGL